MFATTKGFIRLGILSLRYRYSFDESMRLGQSNRALRGAARGASTILEMKQPDKKAKPAG